VRATAAPAPVSAGAHPGALRGVIAGPAIPSPASSFHHHIEPDSPTQTDAIGGAGQEPRPHNRRPPPTYVRSARTLLRGGPTSAESRHASAQPPRASAGPQKWRPPNRPACQPIDRPRGHHRDPHPTALLGQGDGPETMFPAYSFRPGLPGRPPLPPRRSGRSRRHLTALAHPGARPGGPCGKSLRFEGPCALVRPISGHARSRGPFGVWSVLERRVFCRAASTIPMPPESILVAAECGRASFWGQGGS
jgi:hypothetical protein